MQRWRLRQRSSVSWQRGTKQTSAGLRLVESYDASFELAKESHETLEALLSSPVFCKQVPLSKLCISSTKELVHKVDAPLENLQKMVKEGMIRLPDSVSGSKRDTTARGNLCRVHGNAVPACAMEPNNQEGHAPGV
jgi:hypothetical protein